MAIGVAHWQFDFVSWFLAAELEQLQRRLPALAQSRSVNT
jgi:hypothetical protein